LGGLCLVGAVLATINVRVALANLSRGGRRRTLRGRRCGRVHGSSDCRGGASHAVSGTHVLLVLMMLCEQVQGDS